MCEIIKRKSVRVQSNDMFGKFVVPVRVRPGFGGIGTIIRYEVLLRSGGGLEGETAPEMIQYNVHFNLLK